MNLTPDLQSCLVCDDVRQERNGKFILIGLFDAIWGQNFPLQYPRLCAVSRWCSGLGNFTQTTRILKPDRRSVLAQGKPIPVKLADELSTATNVELFVNLSFEEAGAYWIEVTIDETLKLSFPLRVGKLQHPPGHIPSPEA
jgi:hypothetical protein